MGNSLDGHECGAEWCADRGTNADTGGDIDRCAEYVPGSCERARPDDESLDALLAVERTPDFDRALARLLAAHHAAVLQAWPGRSAEAAALSPGGPWGAPGPPSLRGESRGAERKGADKPVGPQLGSEREQEEAVVAEAQGGAGLCSSGGEGDYACCGSDPLSERSPRAAFSEGSPRTVVNDKGATDGGDLLENIILPGRPSAIIDSPQVLKLNRLVGGVVFEVGSAVALSLFCVVTALEMQGEGMDLGYELEYPRYADPAGTAWPQATDTLGILSICFGGIFALEVMLRLVAARKQFLRDWWNVFDVIILAGWIMELAVTQLNSKVLRLARLVRMFRFLRLIKIVRYLEQLYFMVKAFNGCWRALGWACVLLMAVQAFTAFVISQILFTAYFRDEGHPIEQRREVFEYFGSFIRSLLTTFEMTMGNWPIPARVLFENVSEWFMWLFLAHKLVVGFAFVGVINAMFVQETFQIAETDDLTMVLKKQRHLRTQKVKLEKLFVAADNDRNGRVSRAEFARILKHQDVKLWLASMDYDPKDPNYLFDLLDTNKTGDLGATEFLRGMTKLRGPAREMDLLHLGRQQEHVQDIIKKTTTLDTRALSKLLGSADGGRGFRCDDHEDDDSNVDALLNLK